MADDDTEAKRKKAADTEAEAEAVDDHASDVAYDPNEVVAGPDAPADPQIMSMTGVQPTAAAAPVDPRMVQRGHMGQDGPMGHMGGMGHHHMGGGFLQQIFARIQQAQQARQAQRSQMGQQWAQSPMGQQFMQGPMGAQMLQRHPDWAPPVAPAPPGATPANIAVGDHTGEPGPAALPPTAAEQAQQQASVAPQAAAMAAAQQTAPRAPSRDRMPQPMAQARPMAQPMAQPQTRMPTMGAGANDAIAQALRQRNGGFGKRMF